MLLPSHKAALFIGENEQTVAMVENQVLPLDRGPTRERNVLFGGGGWIGTKSEVRRDNSRSGDRYARSQVPLIEGNGIIQTQNTFWSRHLVVYSVAK